MCDRQYLPYHTSIGLVPRSEVSISLQLRPPSMFTFISPQEGEDARWREELELEADTLGIRSTTLRHTRTRHARAQPGHAAPARLYAV